MDKKFPIFKFHQNVVCFNCQKALHGMPSDVMETGYPRGEGKYSQKCNECEMTTFYDLKD